MPGALINRQLSQQDARRLAVQARDGVAEAFDDLVASYAGRLHRYLSMLGVAHHDADDLVQETFIRAYDNLHRYNERYAFSTWLFTIGRRLALNHFRDRRSHVQLEEEVLPPSAGLNQGAMQQVDDADLDGSGIWQQAKKQLSDRHYEALWLFYGEELSMQEVAKVLGITSLNAKVTVHRARKKLAAVLPDPQLANSKEGA